MPHLTRKPTTMQVDHAINSPTHSPPSFHVCHLCSFKARTHRSLKQHVTKAHGSKEKGFRCNTCKKRFDDEEALFFHDHASSPADTKAEEETPLLEHPENAAAEEEVKEDKQESSHDCEVCGKKFEKASMVIEHANRHHPDGAKDPDKRKARRSRRSRRSCDEESGSRRNLERHDKVAHPPKRQKLGEHVAYDLDEDPEAHFSSKFSSNDKEEEANNSTIDKSYTEASSSDLDWKLELSADDGDVSDNADASDDDDGNLAAQVSNFERVELFDVAEKRFRCHVCQLPYSNKQNLKAHFDKVHLRLRKFTCKACGRQFDRLAGIEEHVIKSHDDKWHECAACGQKFGRKHQLRAHNASEHPSLGSTSSSRRRRQPRPKICKICGKRFDRDSRLEQHEATCSGETVVDENHHPADSKVRCPTCRRGFVAQRRLDIHLARFHPAADLSCDGCGRSFEERAQLEQHEATCAEGMGDGGGFACSECSLEFEGEARLNAHLRAAHGRAVEYRCAACEGRFPIVKRLVRHFKREHWTKIKVEVEEEEDVDEKAGDEIHKIGKRELAERNANISEETN